MLKDADAVTSFLKELGEVDGLATLKAGPDEDEPREAREVDGGGVEVHVSEHVAPHKR